jgi:flagellar biosynthesis/type III secretory pathway protein FliH
LGKDLIQKQAIDEVVALPKEDSKRLEILRLLSKWKINMGLDNEIDSAEDRELVMNLTTAYIEWEKETELRGMERGMATGMERGMEIGKETERRSIIESLLLARFGEIDSELTTIVQPMLNLSAPQYAALLLQLSNLSREDLLARFRN